MLILREISSNNRIVKPDMPLGYLALPIEEPAAFIRHLDDFRVRRNASTEVAVKKSVL